MDAPALEGTDWCLLANRNTRLSKDPSSGPHEVLMTSEVGGHTLFKVELVLQNLPRRSGAFSCSGSCYIRCFPLPRPDRPRDQTKSTLFLYFSFTHLSSFAPSSASPSLACSRSHSPLFFSLLPPSHSGSSLSFPLSILSSSPLVSLLISPPSFPCFLPFLFFLPSPRSVPLGVSEWSRTWRTVLSTHLWMVPGEIRSDVVSCSPLSRAASPWLLWDFNSALRNSLPASHPVGIVRRSVERSACQSPCFPWSRRPEELGSPRDWCVPSSMPPSSLLHVDCSASIRVLVPWVCAPHITFLHFPQICPAILQHEDRVHRSELDTWTERWTVKTSSCKCLCSVSADTWTTLAVGAKFKRLRCPLSLGAELQGDSSV